MIRKHKLKHSILSAVGGLSLFGGVVGAGAAGENLIVNPGFDGSIAGWSVGPTTPWTAIGIELPDNTLRVTNNAPWDLKTLGLAVQCVSVEAFKEYRLEAESYLPAGQEREGGAQALLTFNSGTECDGGQLTAWETGTAAQEGTWAGVSITRTAPAGAQSAVVGLSATKNKPYVGQDWEAPLTVYFDNVYFGETSDEADGGHDGPEPAEPIMLEPIGDRDDGPAEPRPEGEPGEPLEEPILEGDPDAGPPDEPEAEGEDPGEPQREPGDGNREPGDEPQDEPQDEPGDEPQREPGDEPQREPGDEPQREPQDEPLDEPQTVDEKAPLPPSTGTGDAFADPDLALAAGVIAAGMAATLGGLVLMPARRKR